MMRRFFFALCVLLGLAVGPLAGVALAAPGDLDPAFGVNGIALTSYGAGVDQATGMCIQPDGKYLLAGTHIDSSGAGSTATLTRFNADGSLDPTFGVIHKSGSLTRLLPSGTLDTTYGTDGVLKLPVDGVLLTLPDGSMLVGTSVWTAWGGMDVAVYRLKADGTLDPSFATAGCFTLDVASGSTDSVESLAIAADGGILVGGQVQGQDGLLLKLTAGGTLDSRFGHNGVVVTKAYAWMDQAFGQITVLPDGKFLTADSGGQGPKVWSRFLPDGSRDATYGLRPEPAIPVGIVAIYWLFPGGAGTIRQAVVAPDGSVILAGVKDNGFPTYNDLWLARINANGTLDTGFGSNGQVVTDLGGADDAAAVGIDATGRLLVAAYARPTAPTAAPRGGRTASAVGQGFACYKGGPSTRPSRPAVSTVSPLKGHRGSIVTITGKNFGKQRGTGYVAFGARRCTTYVSWGPTLIKCKVPANARVGWTRIYITGKGGTARSLQRFAVRR